MEGDCPLTGQQCPGMAQCAPSVYFKKYLVDAMDCSSSSVPLVCPIEYVLRILHRWMLSTALTLELKAEGVNGPNTREEILAALKLDQSDSV